MKSLSKKVEKGEACLNLETSVVNECVIECLFLLETFLGSVSHSTKHVKNHWPSFLQSFTQVQLRQKTVKKTVKKAPTALFHSISSWCLVLRFFLPSSTFTYISLSLSLLCSLIVVGQCVIVSPWPRFHIFLYDFFFLFFHFLQSYLLSVCYTHTLFDSTEKIQIL